MSVHMVLTSPMARNLVKRAVVMSGGNGGGMASIGAAAATPEQVGAQFMASKGIAADDPQALAKMRALSAAQVTDGLGLMTMAQGGKRTFSSPFPDGRILVDVPMAYRTGAFTKVPVMIGATSADIGGNSGSMIVGARDLSAEIAKTGTPVYAYRFSYVAESTKRPGAQHASDIPFFFDTQAIKLGTAATARDNAVGDAISSYVVNFARSGNPNGANLPAWPRYAPAADVIMDFAADGVPRAIKDPLTPAR
jgi:para-nitrobenzyl esterase